MTKRILIPVEDVNFSLQIVPYIGRFFAPYGNKLLLLRVEPDPQFIEVQSPTGEDISLYIDQQMADLRFRFKSEMKPISDELESLGYEVETKVKFGQAAQQIEKTIVTEEIDLVAMATHGREGLQRLIHGSVAEHVLRHSQAPLLLLHPPDETLNGANASPFMQATVNHKESI